MVLENYAVGVMERLGFGYDVLHQINPRIIYASSSGYGGWTIFALLSDGSHGASGLRGHGAHWLCRYATSQSRTSLSDFISGIHLYAALVTALLRRERTGKGCMVEVAMHDAMYPTLTRIWVRITTRVCGATHRQSSRRAGYCPLQYLSDE